MINLTHLQGFLLGTEELANGLHQLGRTIPFHKDRFVKFGMEEMLHTPHLSNILNLNIPRIFFRFSDLDDSVLTSVPSVHGGNCVPTRRLFMEIPCYNPGIFCFYIRRRGVYLYFHSPFRALSTTRSQAALSLSNISSGIRPSTIT